MATMTHLEAVERDLAQGDQPRLFARHQYLIKIKGQAKVPEGRRIVGAQTNREAVV